MPDNDLITVEEAATRLGVSPATIKRRCNSGALAAQRIGRAWLIDATSLVVPPLRPERRRSASASSLVDLPLALRHLKTRDLQRDIWVPDIIRFEDELQSPDTLLSLAAAKLDRREPLDPPNNVPVPKSPFFLRNAVNLSLADRLAYQAAVATFAELVEKGTCPSVFSARLAADQKRSFLRPGTLMWRQWRAAVIFEVSRTRGVTVETDITAYFDCISHTVLLQELQELGAPKVIIDPLRDMLRAWSVTPNTGVPQGPEASRLLANFYLAPVDEVMAAIPGIAYFRYMDDIRIVAPRRHDAVRALQLLDAECRKRNLSLSTKKTALHNPREAMLALSDAGIDAANYSFEFDANSREARKKLRRLFRSALGKAGEINVRRAKYSLFRLRALREQGELHHALKNLEFLAPLGWLVPAYLLPWLRRPSVVAGVCAYLANPERNTADYLSTWLLAALLDEPNAVTPEVLDYARGVSLDRGHSSYHRAVAINVLALGRLGRDIQAIKDVISREYDPEVVRAALVALRRISRLDRTTAEKAQRVAGLSQTVAYLKGRSDLPSIVLTSVRNRIVS